MLSLPETFHFLLARFHCNLSLLLLLLFAVSPIYAFNNLGDRICGAVILICGWVTVLCWWEVLTLAMCLWIKIETMARYKSGNAGKPCESPWLTDVFEVWTIFCTNTFNLFSWEFLEFWGVQCMGFILYAWERGSTLLWFNESHHRTRKQC